LTVRALFFAHLKDMAGTGEKMYHLPDGATVDDFAQYLAAEDVRFNGLLRYARAAINGEWATAKSVLNNDDEIAFLPPSSGG
jgi:molybdopterin converting factor subunit 1